MRGGSCGVNTIAFAANQRDEVRDLGSKSAALVAHPNLKQQTLLAQLPQCLTPWDVQSRRVHSEDGQWPTLYGENGGGHGYAAIAQKHGNCTKCLNPWETQQARVFAEDGVSPTLAGADGGGGRNPAGLVIQNPVAAFLKEPSAKARSIGYSEEISPTLKSSSPCLCEKLTEPSEPATVYGLCAKNSNSMLSGNPHSGIYKADTSRTLDQNGGNPGCNQGGMIIVEPAIILNDQGGDNISVEKSDISPTLRSETHGHLPIVANKDFAFGVHQGQCGDVNVSETAYSLTTNSGASSRNAPLVTHQKPAGVTSKGNGDCFLTTECHCALSQGGGQAGQGYPAVLIPCAKVHPKVTGTLCASASGLSRPGGMASETDLCVAYESPAYALQGNMIGRQDHNGPQGSGVNEDVSFTVTAMDVGGVAAVFSKLRSDNIKETDVACTQTARQYKEATDLVCEIRRAGKCPNPSGVSAVDCRNYKEIGDISGTLQAKDKPGYSLNYQNPVRIPTDFADAEIPCADDCASDVCFAKSGFGDLKEGVGTLCAKGGSYGGGSENLVVSDSTTKYIVRRLTPTECERLQGFPDGWTKYGHDNKEISDTRRYQMLGNSVAIPCVKFVLGGIAYAEAVHDVKSCLYSSPGGGVSHVANATDVS
jgi:DNA (cytosine-5)-methyltransferase 1